MDEANHESRSESLDSKGSLKPQVSDHQSEVAAFIQTDTAIRSILVHFLKNQSHRRDDCARKAQIAKSSLSSFLTDILYLTPQELGSLVAIISEYAATCQTAAWKSRDPNNAIGLFRSPKKIKKQSRRRCKFKKPKLKAKSKSSSVYIVRPVGGPKPSGRFGNKRRVK